MLASARTVCRLRCTLEAIEKVLLDDPAEMTIVYGDTNSTLAGALAAAKLHIPVAHIEAGLRSFNRRMPEEINRVLTDHVSDLLFTPTQTATEHLRHEGIAEDKIHLVGDVMFDASRAFAPFYLPMCEELLQSVNLSAGNYFLATIHRAENTDEPHILRDIIEALNLVAGEIAPVLWPVHPRTRNKMSEINIMLCDRLHLIEPIGYLEMQAYLSVARGVLTDSGGVQKEAAFHRVPTVTLRHETEWPETVERAATHLLARSLSALSWRQINVKVRLRIVMLLVRPCCAPHRRNYRDRTHPTRDTQIMLLAPRYTTTKLSDRLSIGKR